MIVCWVVVREGCQTIREGWAKAARVSRWVMLHCAQWGVNGSSANLWAIDVWKMLQDWQASVRWTKSSRRMEQPRSLFVCSSGLRVGLVLCKEVCSLNELCHRLQSVESSVCTRRSPTVCCDLNACCVVYDWNDDRELLVVKTYTILFV